jgi:hypothetical protein
MSFEGNLPGTNASEAPELETEVLEGPAIKPAELAEKLAANKERNATDLSSMKSQLEEYRTLAGWQPGEGFVTSKLSAKVNKQFVANQALKDRLTLLWSGLQDAEEARNLQTQTENIRLLREDLTDFESEFVVEIDEAEAA